MKFVPVSALWMNILGRNNCSVLLSKNKPVSSPPSVDFFSNENVRFHVRAHPSFAVSCLHAHCLPWAGALPSFSSVFLPVLGVPFFQLANYKFFHPDPWPLFPPNPQHTSSTSSNGWLTKIGQLRILWTHLTPLGSPPEQFLTEPPGTPHLFNWYVVHGNHTHILCPFK